MIPSQPFQPGTPSEEGLIEVGVRSFMKCSTKFWTTTGMVYPRLAKKAGLKAEFLKFLAVMWVKKDAMNHPPNHYVMYCIGGRNHSQKCGLLMFHPHYTFKVFAEDVLALPGRSQCVEMAKEGASVPFVW